MANEFKHISTAITTKLAQNDWEDTDIHRFNNQATGDTLYASSATQLSRKGIGSTGDLYSVQGGVPTWRTPANVMGDLDTGAKVSNSADHTISDQTSTVLTWDTESWDTEDIHSTTSNTSRLTCKTAGKYLIYAYWAFDANSTGYRRVSFKLNGTLIDMDKRSNLGTAAVNAMMAGVRNLSVDDYVEIDVWQNSGGDLNIDSNSTFGMQRIG